MGYGGRRGVPAGSRRRRSFLLYALGSVATFAMAARAVHWLDGPVWLAVGFAAAGLAVAGYWLVRAFLGWRRSVPGRR